MKNAESRLDSANLTCVLDLNLWGKSGFLFIFLLDSAIRRISIEVMAVWLLYL